MDKRYKPSTSQEQLEQRMALIAQMEATPGMPLADAVRLVRTSLHLTQPEFAKLTQVATRTLIDIEAQRANPSMATANKLLSPMGLRLGVVRIHQRQPLHAAQGDASMVDASTVDVAP
jgi:XRE family transcriptional regulator, regulator of sulfur utilization